VMRFMSLSSLRLTRPQSGLSSFAWRREVERGLHIHKLSLHAIEWIVHMPCTLPWGLGLRNGQSKSKVAMADERL
jgi:hypothetical protein